MLKLMGVAMIEAPCEAEAQCAELVKMDLAYGTATEDMDALTFGTKFLLRGFNAKKDPICQIDLQKLLEEFNINNEQFVDLCILCGCDYTQTIGGMGPLTAYKMIKEHKNIEGVLAKVNSMNMDISRKKKFIVPDKFLFQ